MLLKLETLACEIATDFNDDESSKIHMPTTPGHHSAQRPRTPPNKLTTLHTLAPLSGEPSSRYYGMRNVVRCASVDAPCSQTLLPPSLPRTPSWDPGPGRAGQPPWHRAVSVPG